jgi:Flp pilus assembly pilin Flp
VKYLSIARRYAAAFVTSKEEGVTLAEYGLLLALLAGVCLAAITLLGTQISSALVSIAASV